MKCKCTYKIPSFTY